MNNRLYVGNLSFHTTEDVIQNVFSQCGEVVEVKLMIDRESGRSRGFAFVTMASPEAAQAAIQKMNGADLDGRALRVNEAEERRERSGGGAGGGFGRRSGGGGHDRGDRGGRSNDRRGGGGRW